MKVNQINYNYKNINVILGNDNKNYNQIPLNEGAAIVLFNRPKRLNSFTDSMFKEMSDCFKKLNLDNRVNAIVLVGNGRAFSAGLDVKGGGFGPEVFESDPGRAGYKIYNVLKPWQDSVNSIESCCKPVIAAIHGIFYGLGVDLIAACDIRFCSNDVVFAIKEIDIGIPADMGSLQRLPKVVGNHSWLREVCYSARDFMSDEAFKFGLVSRTFKSANELLFGAIQLANDLSEKSPIAITTTKASLVFSLDHSIKDGLEHIATRNMASLNSEDFITGFSSALTKQKTKYSKL